MIKASIFEDLRKRLGGRSVFYVCRDVERAAGLLTNERGIKNQELRIERRTGGEDIGYYIITNNSPYARKLGKKYKNIITVDSASATPPSPLLSRERDSVALLKAGAEVRGGNSSATPTAPLGKGGGPLDTHELLNSPEAKKNIKKNDYVLVFKNTPEIEKICKTNGWKLLNPPASLASKVEEKISQVEWLGPLAKYLPPHKIIECGKINWDGKKFILQFNRAHTGSGTILIENKKQLEEIKQKFPRREARLSDFIAGPVFTNNNVVWGNKILIGNINYQITGLVPFTDSPFATIGNDWALPHKILDKKQLKQYKKICLDVGARLSRSGWKGLYGVDIALEQKTGRLYLIEINARQPASTTYESELQNQESRIMNQVTTFEAHLASLLELPPKNYKLIKINDGAQIVRRIKNHELRIKNSEAEKLRKAGFKVIEYDNTKPGADGLRIQSKKSIMLKHNKFNKLGLIIKHIISNF